MLWSVRARARTAVHRAVGSPLGPPGVLTPARRRASSVLRSPVCVRSRGLRRCALRSGVLRSSPLRSAAPRGAVRCTPASRTPPRRTPARPLSCRPLPPSRNPRPTALRPSGLQPCALSVPPQTPRPLSGRVPCGPPRESPYGSNAAGRSVRSSATKGSPRNRTRDLQPLNPQLSPLGQRGSFLPSIVHPCLSLLGAVGRSRWCARTHSRPRLASRETSRCPRVRGVARSAARARGCVRACARVRVSVPFVRPSVPSVPLSRTAGPVGASETPRKHLENTSKTPQKHLPKHLENA